jgi:GTPase SAR1 family protein
MKTAFLIGTAGSGKTILTNTLKNFLTEQGVTVIAVNLDPAVRRIPYSADVDCREMIDVNIITEDYDLGPNGAMIVATDLLTTHFDEIKEEIAEFTPDICLIDTPGQIELFAYRESGRIIAQQFSPDESVNLFLLDSNLCRNPTSYISIRLLSAAVAIRLGLPMYHILSKSDLLEEEELDNVITWSENLDVLLDAIEGETGLGRELALEMAQITGAHVQFESELIPVSAFEGEGVSEVAAALSRIFASGEDWKISGY